MIDNVAWHKVENYNICGCQNPSFKNINFCKIMTHFQFSAGGPKKDPLGTMSKSFSQIIVTSISIFARNKSGRKGYFQTDCSQERESLGKTPDLSPPGGAGA